MFDKIIQENRFKTQCVIVLYVAIFIIIGLLVDIVRINASSLLGGFYVLITFQKIPIVTLCLLAIACGIVFYTIRHFKGILLSGNEYKEIVKGFEETLQERELSKILDELVREARLDFRPKLYLMDAPFMNAFASGWSMHNSLIALTTTLVRNLKRDEVKAVMAHELSHIRHGDIRLTLMVGVLSNIMLLVVNYGVYMFLGNSRERGANMARTILIVLQFVLPLLTLVLQMFLSRSREYMADSGAAYLMGDSMPMIRALQKISGSYVQSDFSNVDTNPTRSALYIVGFKEIFSTHPSIENRIKALLGK
ncbi:zinc metalloprotease HtpX [Helicobacter canadensis]|uniref:Heat shock protein HtpX n=1 Tax=Helicobacter canadensis MIT 98-5491 TaxID=537970 RepID=C5ZWS9_9HELI|nr:zinc metalloprotease HtpX [Helicobacter canadensis]EES89597.1 heat shock protein HtpX [Helicobacter canadensis MIT 98-5491]EFR48388.1 peptidase, M48 family [Helicobacter canadensis MIT 98-5491]STO99634.1 putative protease htpX-like protein [Helicobacter canadensis]